MKEGGVVVVLYGGTVPFVLRSYRDGQHFRLTEEYYLDRIMNRQAVEEWQESGEPATNLHL